VKRGVKGRSALTNEVLRYLVNHEGAGDTVEGIVGWWLPLERIRYAVTEVEAVLSQLVNSGLVLARRTGDGGIHYRVNGAERAAIERRLRKARRNKKPAKKA